jgi:hypothetical protein
MCSPGVMEEGNFEHLVNFDDILKILQIFSLTTFSLKAEGSLLLEVAKPFKWLDFFMASVQNYPHNG